MKNALQTVLDYAKEQHMSSGGEILEAISKEDFEQLQFIANAFASDLILAKILRVLLLDVTHEVPSAPNAHEELVYEMLLAADYSEDAANEIAEAVSNLATMFVANVGEYY